MKELVCMDLGVSAYGETWAKQEALMQEVIGWKRSALATADAVGEHPAGYLLLVEHPPVYTLGKSGEERNLLLNQSGLSEHHAEFFKTNRGGDITFHGPGQLVVYPILDLERFGFGLRQYIYNLEEVVIQTVAHYGITATRDPEATGVWVDVGKTTARKICAIGVRSSRFVTMHGFALNIHTDLTYFQYIHPCGIPDKGVTSICRETGIDCGLEEVKKHVLQHFSAIFDTLLVPFPV